jgi:hypothetical protein
MVMVHKRLLTTTLRIRIIKIDEIARSNNKIILHGTENKWTITPILDHSLIIAHQLMEVVMRLKL